MVARAPVAVTPAVLRELAPPTAEHASHKGMRGCVLVVGGAAETPGAALLAGIAALRAGAGILQVATAESVAREVAIAAPEARVIALPQTPGGDVGAPAAEILGSLAGEADAVLIGPGLADQRSLAALVPALVHSIGRKPVVVDAVALTAVTPALLSGSDATVVLTPNTKEAAGLLGCTPDEVEADPRDALGRLLETFGATVALRGSETYVGGADGSVYHDTSGSPGLGSSGSGDVLAGFLAGLLARGTAPVAAAVWAVHVHALAGRRLSTRVGPIGYLGRELLDELAPVAAEMTA